VVRKRGKPGDARLYVFFALWAALGLLPYLQIIPLDMTACETWFFASIPGFLGLIATTLKVCVPTNKVQWIYIAAIALIIVLGARTFVRGFDYTSQYTLASKDVSVTKDNYLAMNNLAQSLMQMSKYDQALAYVQDSIAVYPAVTNYTNLGVIQQKKGDFAGAKKAYEKALEYGSMGITYENLGIVNLTIGDPKDNIIYFKKALDAYPRNNRLWTYIALQYAENGNSEEAKQAIKHAAGFGTVPQQLYYAIMTEQAFDIKLPGSSRVIRLP
jgi:tetratricopeptide (TPR) repeat protein